MISIIPMAAPPSVAAANFRDVIEAGSEDQKRGARRDMAEWINRHAGIRHGAVATNAVRDDMRAIARAAFERNGHADIAEINTAGSPEAAA